MHYFKHYLSKINKINRVNKIMSIKKLTTYAFLDII